MYSLTHSYMCSIFGLFDSNLLLLLTYCHWILIHLILYHCALMYGLIGNNQIVLSAHPDAINLLSFDIATLYTLSSCPLNVFVNWPFRAFHIHIVPSLLPDAINLLLSNIATLCTIFV
jgi:hypothetical protein